MTFLTGTLNKFATNYQFSSFIWPTYVFDYFNLGVGNEAECAVKCLLYDYEKCHFYFWSGTTCYIGDFNNYKNTLLGDTSGPIKFLTGSFGK
jgi:hypothetical protein